MDNTSQIPKFTHSGVLPPYLGENPGLHSNLMSPYTVCIKEFVSNFATSPKRNEILTGLFGYRKALRDLGYTNGFQWLNGSFVEDKEPQDIDVVTFISAVREDDPGRQVELQTALRNLVGPNAKAAFKCDAFFVDLATPGPGLVSQTRYWFGLFSHRRITLEWKGLLEVPLCSEDEDVEAFASLSDKEVNNG